MWRCSVKAGQRENLGGWSMRNSTMCSSGVQKLEDLGVESVR